MTAQLERLRDLCVTGDLTKPMYVMQRQVLEEELQHAKPPTDPDLDRAQAILEDFASFWDAEPKPTEGRRLLLSIRAKNKALPKRGEISAGMRAKLRGRFSGDRAEVS